MRQDSVIKWISRTICNYFFRMIFVYKFRNILPLCRHCPYVTPKDTLLCYCLPLGNQSLLAHLKAVVSDAARVHLSSIFWTLLGEIVNAPIINLEAHQLAKSHYLLDYWCLKLKPLEVSFWYAVSSRFPPCRIQCYSRCILSGPIDDFQAVYNVVVLFSKLTKD